MDHTLHCSATNLASASYRAGRPEIAASFAPSEPSASASLPEARGVLGRISRRSSGRLAGVGLLLLAGAAAQAKVYYVSTSGSDNNNGTSSSTPWKSIGKVNTVLSSLGPGDEVLLHRGDVFRDDFLLCTNTKSVKSGMTVSKTPPTCSGSAAAPLVIGSYGSTSAANPILDGANPLSLKWTLVSGETWETTISGTMPAKLFVDGGSKETAQLLPVPNATGGYVSSATYHPYDLVSSGGSLYVRGPLTPSSGIAPTNAAAWISLANSFAGNTSQNFSGSNSGETNVKDIAGSWYGSGNKIYVHLADGSNPNSHSFEGSTRSYGVLLLGVNYVTVENLTVEHTVQSGIVSAAGPAYGTYFTGENNRIINNQIWNYGSISNDNLNLGVHFNSEVAGILVRASGEYNPHLVRNDYVGGNYIGHNDAYYGIRSAVHFAGITAIGIDGLGTENNKVIENNYISTVNSRGIVYNNGGILSEGAVSMNNGGRITNNELVNNQGNIFFSATVGGLVDHNKVHHSYGEGIQSGGASISTSSVPQIFSYNLIYHLGESASLEQFNGFDCNGTLANGYWMNNTVYDTYGAAITLEDGCTYAHVHNNIFDQDALQFPAYKVINASFLLYYDQHAGNVGPDFSNNIWVDGPQWHPFFGNGAPFNCTTFFTEWPDRNSKCVTNPGFTDPDSGDFSLTSSSPALRAAEGGLKAGAIQ